VNRSLLFAFTAGVAVLAAPAEAGRDKPIQNLEDVQVSWMAGVEPSMEKMGHAIIRACARLGWVCTIRSPGEIHGHLSLRVHEADVRIPFTADSYSILYESSVNLRYDAEKNTIHRNYNNWILNLQRNIDVETATASCIPRRSPARPGEVAGGRAASPGMPPGRRNVPTRWMNGRAVEASGPLQVLLLITYAILAHLWAARGESACAALAILVLLGALTIRPLLRGSPWALGLLAAAAAVVGLTNAAHWAALLLFLPPVIINLGLAWLFGHTLARGRTPLVAQIVALLHPDNDVPDESVWDYARSVTVCWTVLFCVNASICLVLALLATPLGLLSAFGIAPPFGIATSHWSGFANFGCYGLSGLMFVLEYAYRRRRYPEQPYRNLFHFLARAASVGPALSKQLRTRNGSGPGA